MNRATTIPAGLVAVGITIIYALGDRLMKNEALMDIIGIVATMSAVAVAFAWGYVEWYKRGEFAPDVLQAIAKPYRGKSLDPHARERNLVYRRAVAAGFWANLSTGVVFLLLENASTKDWIVVGVGWGIWSAVIGFATPWLWRIVFYHCRPSRKMDPEEKL